MQSIILKSDSLEGIQKELNLFLSRDTSSKEIVSIGSISTLENYKDSKITLYVLCVVFKEKKFFRPN